MIVGPLSRIDACAVEGNYFIRILVRLVRAPVLQIRLDPSGLWAPRDRDAVREEFVPYGEILHVTRRGESSGLDLTTSRGPFTISREKLASEHYNSIRGILLERIPDRIPPRVPRPAPATGGRSIPQASPPFRAESTAADAFSLRSPLFILRHHWLTFLGVGALTMGLGRW
jgi:hypothetical protein